MIRLILAAALLSSSGTTVTRAEFDEVQPGMTKRHVQEVFGTKGEVVVEWHGGKGWAHQWKNYPTSDGQWAQIIYSHGPNKRVWRLAQHDGKNWCPEAHIPCTSEGVTA